MTLTAYKLACGTVQRVSNDTVSLALWYEHSRYHVRAHSVLSGRLLWQSFQTLTEARKFFTEKRKELHL
jgi:hypothetical protein